MAAFNEWLFDAFEGEVFVEEIAAVIRVKDHDAMSLHMQGAPNTLVLGGTILKRPLKKDQKLRLNDNPILYDEKLQQQHDEVTILTMTESKITFRQYSTMKEKFATGGYWPSQRRLHAATKRLELRLVAHGVWPPTPIFADEKADLEQLQRDKEQAEEKAQAASARKLTLRGGDKSSAIMLEDEPAGPAAAPAPEAAPAPPVVRKQIGAYIPMDKLLAFSLQCLSMDEFKAVTAGQERSGVRISADGRQFSRDLSTIGGFVRWFKSGSSTFQEFPWFILEGKETYGILKTYLQHMFEELPVVERDGIQCKIQGGLLYVKFHLDADWKMIALLTGTDEARAWFFCMVCDASKDRMREAVGAIIGVHCECPIAVQHQPTCQFHFKVKSLEYVKQLLEAGAEASMDTPESRKEAEELRRGQKEAPIWPFGSLPDRVAMDNLHWMINMVRCVTDGVIDICRPCNRELLSQCFRKVKGIYLGWVCDSQTGAMKRTKFLGESLRKILADLNVREAHAIAGYDEFKCARAVETWGLLQRLMWALSHRPSSRPYGIEPAHFKVLADVLIADIGYLYGRPFCAAYTHATTDHIAAQMQYLEANGIALGAIGCQTVERHNQVRCVILSFSSIATPTEL